MTAPENAPRSYAVYADAIRALLLAGLVVVLWCSAYDRWTGEAWRTPLTYREQPEKGDVLVDLAFTKAAEAGHFPLFWFKTVPELGAPYDANWNDWPITESVLVLLPGVFARFIGVFAGLNLAVLLSHVLSALAFYVACRLLKCSWLWAFCGALIFSFARYAFAHGEHHYTVAYYWHVPLCLVACKWVIDPEGIGLKGRRFYFAMAVAFATGMQHVYYTNMFDQLILFGGVVQWMRKGWRAALPAAAIIGSSAAAFLLMNSPTILYQLVNGPNGEATVRPYKWIEIAALKLVDLLVPPPDHHFPPFAHWGADHLKEIVLPPGEWPPTGYLGLVGIAALTFLAVVSFKRVVKAPGLAVPLEAWQVLWILLYAGVGGVNGFAGTLGFRMFRAGARFSIFILAIVLIYAAIRLSRTTFKRPILQYVAAFCAVAFALWDQMPPWVEDKQVSAIASAVAADRQFTHEMEERLPKGAMVFQIPVMEFPESPAPGVGSYDHFRPYLYSDRLRFSFGSTKGRFREKWQQRLAKDDLATIVSDLESYGFAAIYINKEGFGDHSEAVIKALAALGRSDKVESKTGDLCCVFLHPSDHPVLP